jgi:P27 family predicted phage terminase small subunit
MGRPRKLLNAQQGNLTQEQQFQKKKEEEKLYNYEPLDFSYFPMGLLRGAYPEWERIGNFAGSLPLSELDSQTLVSYCNYVYLYGKLAEEVSVEGEVTSDGKLNPKVTAMMGYSKQIKSATNDLGLTINSRLKLVAPKEVEDESKDPLGQLLKMRTQA